MSKSGLGVLTSKAAKSVYAGLLGTLIVAGGLYGLVILFGPKDTVIYLLALGIGVGWLPAVWYVIGKELPRGWRGFVSRILWTVASLTHGPYAAFWRESGRIETVPADPENDRIFVDGEWRGFDPDGNWSRLGKQPFVVVWEKTMTALDGVAVEGEDGGAAGGPQYLGTRGGEHIATKAVSTAENVVVDLGRVVARWRGAAGGTLADAAKKDALLEYGGQLDISTRWLVLGILGSLALGTISGYVLFAA